MQGRIIAMHACRTHKGVLVVILASQTQPTQYGPLSVSDSNLRWGWLGLACETILVICTVHEDYNLH